MLLQEVVTYPSLTICALAVSSYISASSIHQQHFCDFAAAFADSLRAILWSLPVA